MHMALADINTLYGVGNGHDHADLAALIPRMDETARQLLAFAPPIGVGGDSCTYVEVTAGARVGEIMYTDGEMYPGYFDEVDTD